MVTGNILWYWIESLINTFKFIEWLHSTLISDNDSIVIRDPLLIRNEKIDFIYKSRRNVSGCIFDSIKDTIYLYSFNIVIVPGKSLLAVVIGSWKITAETLSQQSVPILGDIFLGRTLPKTSFYGTIWFLSEALIFFG